MRKWVWLTCAVLFGTAGVLQYLRYSTGELTGPAAAWVLLAGAAVLFAGFLYGAVKDRRAYHSAGPASAGSDTEKGAKR